MRLLLLMMILLAFPVMELVLLVKLASIYGGWWVLGFVVFSAMVGGLLIKGEWLVVFARVAQTLRSGEHPLIVLLTSAKTIVAGALLIFPGVISDLLALLLLIFPISLLRRPRTTKDIEIIEAEWRRED